MDDPNNLKLIPPPDSQHHSRALLYGVAAVFLLIAGIGAGYLLGTKQSNSETSTVSSIHPTVMLTPTPSPDETMGWKTYNNSSLGISFKYPSTYKDAEEQQNYISIISPLNTDRGKGYSLQNGELKLEIYFENIKQNDTVEKFVEDHKGEGTILKSSETTIDGVQSIHQEWEGYGTGETYYVIHNGKRFLIIKYPLETTRQAEFAQILSSFKFTVSGTTSKVPADSQTPTAGACSGPTTDPVVVVSFAPDNVPNPRCTKVTSNQKLEIVNNSGKTITGSVGNYTINVVSGSSQTIDATFGAYLETGVHRIVGAEIWLQ